jgi:hypothetical protein
MMKPWGIWDFLAYTASVAAATGLLVAGMALDIPDLLGAAVLCGIPLGWFAAKVLDLYFDILL